jgi:hypothetical protein
MEFWEGFGITIKSVVQTAPISATAAVPETRRILRILQFICD